MPKLFGAFSALAVQDEASVAGIMKDAATPKAVIALVREIVSIAYLGVFYQPNPERTPMPPSAVNQYLAQQMFPLIKARVRGCGDQPHAHWRTKPAGE